MLPSKQKVYRKCACCQAKDHSVILASHSSQGRDAFSLKKKNFFFFLAKPMFIYVVFWMIFVLLFFLCAFYFFFLGGVEFAACRISVLQSGIGPRPQQWQCRILTTRPPANSPKVMFYFSLCTLDFFSFYYFLKMILPEIHFARKKKWWKKYNSFWSNAVKLKEETEQVLSWKQGSILGWTVDFELYAQYLWKWHTNWKSRPLEGRAPVLSIA